MASVADEINEEKPNFYTLKQRFESKGSSLAVERLHVLNEIKQGLYVLSLDEDIFETAKEFMKQYGLLPNDALITPAKHNRIELIATYDSDFSRVTFLEVLNPEESRV
jgi:predicted nucleic acid-binding protein